jgi:hypothetical protein
VSVSKFVTPSACGPFYRRCGYNEPGGAHHVAIRLHHRPFDPPSGSFPGPPCSARDRGGGGHPTLPRLKKAPSIRSRQPRCRLAEVRRGIPLARSSGRSPSQTGEGIPQPGPREQRVSQLRRLHAHRGVPGRRGETAGGCPTEADGDHVRRSVPNGFSTITRAPRAHPDLPSWPTTTPNSAGGMAR